MKEIKPMYKDEFGEALTEDSPVSDWPHTCCICEKELKDFWRGDDENKPPEYYQLDDGVELEMRAYYGSRFDDCAEFYGVVSVGCMCDDCYEKVSKHFKRYLKWPGTREKRERETKKAIIEMQESGEFDRLMEDAEKSIQDGEEKNE